MYNIILDINIYVWVLLYSSEKLIPIFIAYYTKYVYAFITLNKHEECATSLVTLDSASVCYKFILYVC